MNIFIKKIYLVSVGLAMFFFAVADAHAASVSFGLDAQKVRVGDHFVLTLYLEDVSEPINALGGVITFREDYVVPREIRDGSSLVSHWIEQPRHAASGEIVFSGIMPGGYQGGRGRVVDIVFEAVREVPTSIFALQRIEVFGSEGVPIQISGTPVYREYAVLPQAAGNDIRVVEDEDRDPPEPFEVLVVKDEVAFDGKYVAIFVAQDKGSGISHFLIKEGWWRPAVRATSPYILKNQKLTSSITVHAVDHRGNIRTVRLEPSYAPFLSEMTQKIIVCIFLFILIIYGGWFLFKKLRQ